MRCPRLAFPVAIFIILLANISAHAQNWGSAVWADEFNGAANSAIDPTKWTYDTGFLNVNSELEIYCSPSMNTQGCDPTNPNEFIDGNGHLMIQQRLANAGATWTSARLKTQGLKTFQYGRIEANLQIPSHQGLWPAFWMLGANIDSIGWPSCGEVDIMENWPGQGGTGGGINHNATSMHGQGYSGGNSLSHTMTFPAGQDVTGFHTYGIIWSPNMMQFYFDDPNNITFVRTPDDIPAGTTWPYNNPFFLITNMAVGGILGGPPDSGTPTATPVMALDYVRYYQAQTIAGPTMTPANAISVAAGASGNTTINLNSSSGSGLVYLACSGAPTKATCSINTNNSLDSHVVDFRSASSAQATVNVTTTANTASLMSPRFSAWATMLGFGAFVLVPVAPKRASQWSRRLALLGGVLAILFFAAAFQGCGGSSGGSGGTSGGGGGGATNGTPAGQYKLTITAYTVSGDTSTANVTLNVN